MKKLIAIVFILAVVFCFAACGNGSDSSDVPEDLDLNAVYESIIENRGVDDDLALYNETSEEIINGFYDGLSDVELNQEVLYMHFVTGAPTEICLVEVADSADVKAVQKIFQARIDLGAGDEFYPENAVDWQNNAQIQTKGNYVAMICLPDIYTVPEDVFALN